MPFEPDFRVTLFHEFAVDVRYALRALRGASGFTVGSLATLSVGIATFAAIGTVFYGVYLRPLPFRDPDRLAAIAEYVQRGPRSFSSVRSTTIQALKQESAEFERIAVFQTGAAQIVDGNEVRHLALLYVDTAFGALFDIMPLHGRFLSKDEIEAGAHVATISEVLFRSTYGGDSNVVGHTIALADTLYVIVGVMPHASRFPSQTDVWVPLPKSVLLAPNAEASVVARIRPHISRDQARASLAATASRLTANSSGPSLLVLQDEPLDRRGQSFFPEPGILLAATALVLLATGSNVTNLFMARATGRSGEMALRAALGASPLQLARLALIESSLLACGATVGGVAMSIAIVKVGFALFPLYDLPFWLHFDLDSRFVAVCAGLSVAIALGVGLAPAKYAASPRLIGILRRAGDGAATARTTGKLGAVLQIATGVVLFVACGMLVQSRSNLLSADMRYPASRIISVLPNFDHAGYSRERAMQFMENLLPEVTRSPGVAGVATRGYYIGPRSLRKSEDTTSRPDFRVFLDGDTVRDRSPMVRPGPRTFVVSDGYFSLLELKIRTGRGFTSDDAPQNTPVVVLSRAFASALWGNTTPLGRRLQWGTRGQAFTVVGIVDDVDDVSANQDGISFAPRLDAYFSSRQALARLVGVYIRTDEEMLAVRRAAMALVRHADPKLQMQKEPTMRGNLDYLLSLNRVFTALLAAFALTAMTIAAIGLYALIAYGVTLRAREIGIRMALGARPSTLIAMIVRESLPVMSSGLMGGLVVGLGAAKLLRYFVYGVSTADPPSFLLATCIMAVMSVSACVIPMWLATRVDTSRVLRAE